MGMTKTERGNYVTTKAKIACRQLGAGWEPVAPNSAASMIERLYAEHKDGSAVATRLNGFSREDLEELEGNSGAGQGEGSTSV